ncbi:MAG: hypothetical protein ACYSSI_13840 [Planctomycetota bacterium]|jgi:hypothetical protein
MKRFSRQLFVVMLFGQVFTAASLAETTKILSGRDLLKAVRQSSGGVKPAYAKRLAESKKPVLSNSQKQTQSKTPEDKSLKTTFTNYTKDTRNGKTRPSLIPKVRKKQSDKITRTKTAFYKSSKQIGSISTLTSDTPFVRAIDILRSSVEPPLKIVVLWRDLQDNADINPTSPINIDGMPAVSLRTTLKLLLESVSNTAELGYVVDNGVIVIATKQSLPKKLELRIYDITDLLAKPADFRGSLGGSGRNRGTTDSFDEDVDWD